MLTSDICFSYSPVTLLSNFLLSLYSAINGDSSCSHLLAFYISHRYGGTKLSIMQNDPYVNEQQQSINSSIYWAVLFVRMDAY